VLVAGGSTNVTTYFALRLAADGTAATGLTIANIDLQYTRSGVAPTAKVDATALAATDTAHTDNYAIEIDATDQPGLYRVDWPDAAFAAGVREVILSVKCATVFTEHLRVEIDAPVNTTQISGDATAADNAESFFDGTGYAGTNNVIPSVTTVTGNVDGSVGSVTGAVGSVTGAVGSVAGNVDGNVTGSVGSNLELGPAEVNAEVVDALNTDTYAEPAQGAPGATITLAQKIGYLYKAWRNRSNQTATTYQLFNDDATTVDHKATVSDDATTAEKGEVATGP